MTDKQRIKLALIIAYEYGGIDGDHHQKWVVDQIVRALTGDGYDAWVKRHNRGPEGPHTYEWETGIAP